MLYWFRQQYDFGGFISFVLIFCKFNVLVSFVSLLVSCLFSCCLSISQSSSNISLLQFKYKNSLLQFCCITNYHKIKGYTQHKFIISWFLCIRGLSIAQLGLLQGYKVPTRAGFSAGGSLGKGFTSELFKLLEEFTSCVCKTHGSLSLQIQQEGEQTSQVSLLARQSRM